MLRRRAWASFALAAGSAAMPMAAHADVTFHGFGQVVVGSTLSNQHAAFPSKNYSADPSFAPESLLALQVQSPLADRIEATAQIVSTGADGNNFVPKFEWA